MSLFRSAAQCTVNQTFRTAVECYADRLFLDFSGDKYTYGDIDREVERVTRGLHKLGVKRGDRVVTVLDNGPDAVISWLAINRLGAVNVPVNTAYKGEFLRHQVADSGAKIAIFEAEYVKHIDLVWSGVPQLKHVLYRGGALSVSPTGGKVSPLDDYRLDSGEAPWADVAPSDLASLIYTSGTTGPSKGCMVSHNYICDLSERFAQISKREPDELYWTPLPLFHIYAISIVLSTIQMGSSASLAKKFSVRGFWPEIERTGARVASILGSMAAVIANAPETSESKRCYGQLRALLAVPCPPALKKIWRERYGVRWPALICYGQTEAGCMVTCPVDEDAPDGTSGALNGTLDVRIFDENDQELPPNHVGEVVVRPLKPHVMFSGYWNRVDSSFALARNYWHHTGDLGKFDENGYFFFVDRQKDYLRRRGENISSFEVEMSLAKHPAISEVAVHAVSSELTEDDVKATIVLKSGFALSEVELLEWAVDYIPKFALPRYVEYRDELPKNAVGRVLKYQLREEGVTAATWDREKADYEMKIKS